MNLDKYFIHFGCWNNGGCPKNNDLTKVLNSINSLTDKPEFLSVCGDNYYPIKNKVKGEKKDKSEKKDNKQLILEDLISGFNCLPKDIPIYMTYGNHDYETDLLLNGIQETDCTLTKQEIEIVENHQNIQLKLYNSLVFNNNTKILFIDTTLYDNEDIQEYFKCYNSISDKYNSIDTVKSEQLEFIKLFVSSIINDININNIIIVGHHPLAQFKYKKEVMNYLILSEELNNILFKEIYNELKTRNINYYYLCADLHQYQSGNIIINNEMPIRQYIVGTAGAKKDEVLKDMLFTSPQYRNNIEYVMTPEDIQEATDNNGYLKCIADGNNIRFEFIQVNNNIGGKRRTRRTRRKRRTRRTRRTKN